ncbi:MAG TPA: nucleotidyltransferase family protein [Chroococcidiopsis sp.]
MALPLPLAQSAVPAWQPTQPQRLLLQAVLAEDAIAREAWSAWKTLIDLDHLDEGSYLLLPRLYQRLRALGIDDALVQRCKGVYRHVWSRNQVKLRELTTLVQLLRAAQVEPMLLWGAALILQPGQDPGIRRADDSALYVRFADMPQALAALQDAGWVPTQAKAADVVRSQQHAIGLSLAGQSSCTLQWHVLPEWCQPDLEQSLWSQAIPVTLGAESVLSLHPADQFVCATVRATQWATVPPFHWLADAAALLQANAPDSAALDSAVLESAALDSATINWAAIIARAQQTELIWALRQGLTQLHQILPHLALSQPLADLAAQPLQPFERAEFNANARPHPVLGSLPTLWFQFRRLQAQPDRDRHSPSFLAFLQQRWGIHHGWHLPRHLLTQGRKRLKRLLATQGNSPLKS